MIIILSLIGVFAVGFVVCRVTSYLSDWNTLGALLMGVGALGLFFALLFIPIAQMVGKDNVERYHALKESIEYARDNGDQNELNALQVQINELNQDLASARYWNEHYFDWYINDKVAELEPLR